MRIGIDIGGTKADAVVLEEDGSVAHSVRLPTGWGPDGVVDTVLRAVHQVADLGGFPISSTDSIGIGIPGAVDAERGIVTHARNLGIEHLALAEVVMQQLGVPVRVENDVNAAALGAFHHFGLGATDSLAFLNLGTGVAAGLVLGGDLWRGARGAAGEIGQILFDPAGPLDRDGQAGTLEVLASGSGIAAQWHGATASQLVEAARAGDPEAMRIRDRLFDAVAAAIRILVLTTDVELVVIGGGLAVLGDVLLAAIRDIDAGWTALSPFIASLHLGDRTRVLEPGSLTAATGAAWTGAASWQK